MESIQLKNLRSIRDSGEIKLNKLNIFLGANSTGKSTILRFFPLLKQTLARKTRDPLLWYDKEGVDFGSFNESINYNNKDKYIEFELKFNANRISDQLGNILLKEYQGTSANNRTKFKFHYNFVEENVQITFKIKNNKFTYINLTVDNNKLSINFEKDNIVVNGNVYNFESTLILKRNFDLLPRIIVDNKHDLKLLEDYLAKRFIDIIRKNGHKNISNNTYSTLFTSIVYSPSFKEFYSKNFSNNNLPISIKEMPQNIIEELFDYNIVIHIMNSLDKYNAYISNYSKNINYIGPVRASAERYYRIQGLSVDDVDSMGTNVPMILHSFNSRDKKNWTEWTKKKFDIEYYIKESKGHSAIRVKTFEGDFNLADTGFGYSQMLPILLVIWLKTQHVNDSFNKKLRKTYNSEFLYDYNSQPSDITIVIEQPELHLHPKMQARVADILFDLVKNLEGFKMIIETHSVVIMNRLGELIENDNVTENNHIEKDINIFLVNSFEKSQNNQIILTQFDKEGIIDKWPLGFLSGGDL